ncbi:hypothetical protein [Paraburkholderia diazotrophica]|uniref:Uncharacterized protein n=1 Tax=Paraburkholderia diazotrophica TaxID=667676 RepID=A0A1H7E3S5_9BURK|nr:hypothetical protein [Paraburkholderia diazotrophica]SEK08498.1 hypothetical protein SAMN05192539_104128 [Paraburkholderia diazotrophica]
MEPLRTLITVIVLLAVTALGGLVMAGMRFAGKDYPPAWLAMLHGALAAAAVTLLIYAALTIGLPGLAMAAIVLFIVAGGGGVVMNLAYHWNKRALPKSIVVLHALAAVVGFILLIVAAWSSRG